MIDAVFRQIIVDCSAGVFFEEPGEIDGTAVQPGCNIVYCNFCAEMFFNISKNLQNVGGGLCHRRTELLSGITLGAVRQQLQDDSKELGIRGRILPIGQIRGSLCQRKDGQDMMDIRAYAIDP